MSAPTWRGHHELNRCHQVPRSTEGGSNHGKGFDTRDVPPNSEATDPHHAGRSRTSVRGVDGHQHDGLADRLRNGAPRACPTVRRLRTPTRIPGIGRRASGRGPTGKWLPTSGKDRDQQSHAETREQRSDHRPGPAGAGGFSDVAHAGQSEEATAKDHRYSDEPADEMLGTHVPNSSVESICGVAHRRAALFGQGAARDRSRVDVITFVNVWPFGRQEDPPDIDGLRYRAALAPGTP